MARYFIAASEDVIGTGAGGRVLAEPIMTFVYLPNDATAVIGATTTVAGTAQNAFGWGEQDLFLREAGSRFTFGMSPAPTNWIGTLD